MNFSDLRINADVFWEGGGDGRGVGGWRWAVGWGGWRLGGGVGARWTCRLQSRFMLHDILAAWRRLARSTRRYIGTALRGGLYSLFTRICLAYRWHIFVIYLTYLWHIFSISLAYILYIFGISLAYLYHIFGISLSYLWHIFGISLEYL